MAITFYTNPMSRGRIGRWALEEAGCDYDTVVVQWGDKPQALLDANSLGKLPTIVHDGRVVSEAAAICAYLADTFPDAKLAPTADERADYYRWLFFAAGPIEQAITDKSLGLTIPADKKMMVGYGDFDSAVAAFEQAVGRHDFIAGDRFTAADVYVGSQVLWGLDFGTLPKRPAFEAYAGRLREREAYRRSNAKDDALMPKDKQPA